MAAIKPHLAQDHETTEIEGRYFECLSEAQDKGDLGELDRAIAQLICPTPAAVLDQSHASLMQVVYTREIVLRQLEGARITPGYKGGDVVLFVDRDARGPAWNPMLEVGSTSLLSWTTKMGTPSFSLPAGAPTMGGSCPGAMAGQTVVPDKQRSIYAERLLPLLPKNGREKRVLHPERTICELCYAEGGQYATGSVQYHQMVRFAWVRRAIRMNMRGDPIGADEISESAFVQVMIDAINRVDFEMEGEHPRWGKTRFFRCHDSGDFFSSLYLMAWRKVAEHFHPANTDSPIIFWAPSRIWAEGEEKVRQLKSLNGPVRGEPTNLVIRPSAYEVNEPGPELPAGWASASTVFHESAIAKAQGDAFDWDCRAYQTEKGPSCRGAEASDKNGRPMGEKGCRTCWVHPHLRVNYTLHGPSAARTPGAPEEG